MRDERRTLIGASALALVDRNTAPFVGEWAAGIVDEEDDLSPTITLRWQREIDASALVVYVARTESEFSVSSRDQTISGFTVRTFVDDEEIDDFYVGETITQEGTRVELDPRRSFKRLDVSIRQSDVRGIFEGLPTPALAEIEVIGQVTEKTESTAMFRHGDSDCNDSLSITDAVTTLNGLFLGTVPFC